MNILSSIQGYLQKKVSISLEKPVVEAYDIWSGSYDAQPGNLMLDLDSVIFSSLIKDVKIQNKRIADIGCGTGRHWQLLYDKSPVVLTGYDVSAGMLNQLRKKFPTAITRHVTNNLLTDVPAASVHCIISTLTIAHIENINEAISSWARILKEDGDLIITDFHPAILSAGGKRSFSHAKKSYTVLNYVHPINELKSILKNNGFKVMKHEERFVDESVRSYYEQQNAMAIYEKFKGMPVIYGLHLKR